MTKKHIRCNVYNHSVGEMPKYANFVLPNEDEEKYIDLDTFCLNV